MLITWARLLLNYYEFLGWCQCPFVFHFQLGVLFYKHLKWLPWNRMVTCPWFTLPLAVLQLGQTARRRRYSLLGLPERLKVQLTAQSRTVVRLAFSVSYAALLDKYLKNSLRFSNIFSYILRAQNYVCFFCFFRAFNTIVDINLKDKLECTSLHGSWTYLTNRPQYVRIQTACLIEQQSSLQQALHREQTWLHFYSLYTPQDL